MGHADKTQEKKIFFCLIPHYDDEVFLAPFLRNWAFSGHQIHFIYLSSCAASDEVLSGRRARESENFLKKLLPVDNYFLEHVGRKLKIDDGYLLQHLGNVFDFLTKLVKREKKQSPVSLIAPAWEGGHPDHDAAYIMGLLLSKKTGSQLSCYACYTGRSRRGKWFQVLANPSNSVVSESVTCGVLFSLSLSLAAFWFFRSQWRSWIGLTPFLLLRLLTRRKISMYRPGTLANVVRPHTGKLLYERYGRMTWDEFYALLEQQLSTIRKGG